MKKCILGLLVFMGILLFAGCGEKEGASAGSGSSSGASGSSASSGTASSGESSSAQATTESNLTSDKITLKVWESSGASADFVKQAGEAFTAKYPNITIEYENVELSDSSAQIPLDGPAGVGPDVFATPSNTIGVLVAGGHILPVGNSADVVGQVAQSCEDAVIYNEKIYGYPISAETYALYYNKDLIPEPPTTWEEVEAFCQEFNEPGTYGMIFNVGAAYYSPVFTGKNGNRLFGQYGTDTSSTFMNNADAVEGMTYFQSFRQYLDVPATDIANDAVCLAAFTEGKAAMYITGPWNIANCRDAEVNFGVTTLPALPGDNQPATSFSGARTMQVSAYSDYPAEAHAFAKFLISEEMQQLRFDITGEIPSVGIEVSNEYITGFQKQLEFAYPMPSIVEMDGWWGPMDSACANIWDGADVQAELDAVNSTVLQ